MSQSTPENQLPPSKRISMRKVRPRTGKIAQLPAPIRAEINRMMRDNVIAREILAWLKREHPAVYEKANFGPNGPHNISTWRYGGYEEWVRQQERLEEMKAQRELAFEIAQQSDGTIQAANLAIVASHIYEALQNFDIKLFGDKLLDKPELYSILIDGVSKLSRAGVEERKLQLELTKYKDRVAELKRKIEAELGQGQKKGGLTPENLKAIEEALNLL